jgi:Domain of unknown function (DUF6378)
MWSALLGITITAEDVAIMMIAFKLARLKQTPTHRDTKVDVIGYTICLDRLDEEPEPDLSPYMVDPAELAPWERDLLMSQVTTREAA